MPASDTKKRPILYIFFDLIASGKSTLALAWATNKRIRSYNSDRVRKELAGINPTESRRETVDAGIYTQKFSRRTYRALLDLAETELRRGDSVVLDASYQHRRDRQDVRNLAAALGCRVYFILCQCPETELQRRMAAREKDPTSVSDGRWEIYLQQKKRFEPPDELTAAELIPIDTQAPPDQLIAILEQKLLQ